MTDIPETVVLVADDGTPVGTAPKATVHSTETPLHLAFSCHVFDDRGRVLVTRRALAKKTWPGVWTNAFCGHPAPEEPMVDALVRRAERKLGLALTDVRVSLPDFRYRAVDASGVVENEICPVYIARTDDEVAPNPLEVVEARWVDPEELGSSLATTPWAFSPWLVLQSQQLRIFESPQLQRRAS